MKFGNKLTVALLALVLTTKLNAQQTAVIINLTEQAAYLVEDGRAVLISPIASGKEGRGTPSGTFRIISKDLKLWAGDGPLRENSRCKRDPSLTRPAGLSLRARSDAVLHGIQ
jgi:hypothetical protein